MPQSERSDIMKKLLKWLISLEQGATNQAIHAYVQWEICEGGATNNSIKKYVEDLCRAHLIDYKAPFYRVTNAGKEWLERHSI